MKILYLTNNLTGQDGWSRYSLDIIQSVQRQGHQVLCLVNQLTKQVDIPQQLILASPLRYLANPFLSYLTAKKINPLLKQFKPQVIHFIVEPYAVLLPFLKFANSQTVITVHGTYAYAPVLLNSGFKRLMATFLTRQFYQVINQIITVSRFTKQHLLNQTSVHGLSLENKITVISNGLNLKNFSLIDLKAKSVNSIKQLLFVGGIKPAKGILESLQALKYYAKHYNKNFIYNLIGRYYPSDFYYQKLRRYIKQNHLENHVKFVGQVEQAELLNYYRRADLFLMLSRNKDDKWLEGFGLVYLEANSQGVPAIGSMESGAVEAIADGISGYVVDPNQPQLVAKKIDQVLNQQAIQPIDCLNWAKQHDIQLKAEQILKLYQTLCV